MESFEKVVHFEGGKRGFNRPHSIYQYSNMDPRLSGQNYNFLKFLNLSFNFQKRLGYKETTPNIDVCPKASDPF